MGREGKHRYARITARETAEAMNVHPNTVSNWLRRGWLKGLKLKDILDFDRARRKSEHN